MDINTTQLIEENDVATMMSIAGKALTKAGSKLLTEILAEAKADKDLVAELKDKLETAAAKNAELSEKLTEHGSLDERERFLNKSEEELDTRENAIIKRENAAELKELQIKFDMQTAHLHDFKEMNKVVFRNASVQRTVFQNDMSTPEYDNQQGKNVYRKTGETTTENQIVD